MGYVLIVWVYRHSAFNSGIYVSVAFVFMAH